MSFCAIPIYETNIQQIEKRQRLTCFYNCVKARLVDCISLDLQFPESCNRITTTAFNTGTYIVNLNK